MKKNVGICVLVMVLILVGTGFGYAISFNDIKTYTNDNNVNDNPNDPPGYSAIFSHTLNFSPPLGNFNSAHLDINYYGVHLNENQIYELWYALGSKNDGPPSTFTQLGQVAGSGPDPRTQTFDLSALEPVVPLGGLPSWKLYFAFREDTEGLDVFTLNSSRVYGDYQSVPEPSIILLLCCGLLGLGGSIRGFKES